MTKKIRPKIKKRRRLDVMHGRRNALVACTRCGKMWLVANGSTFYSSDFPCACSPGGKETHAVVTDPTGFAEGAFDATPTLRRDPAIPEPPGADTPAES